LNSISTLEPFNFNFANEFITNTTQFLELPIKFGSIPGYEIREIDESNSRLVLTDEDRDAALLNIYLYNYMTNKYEKVNFKCYDDYSKSSTFSFVVDRSQIDFEHYFNATNTNSYQITAILSIEGIFDSGFYSNLDFEIESINANIYHGRPINQFSLNPRLDFAIDLSDYIGKEGISLSNVYLNLFYSITLNLDPTITYALVTDTSERCLLYGENKYGEYEELDFDSSNGVIFLSSQEVNSLVHYDPISNKYLLHLQLSYEWQSNLILYVNSKLDFSAELAIDKIDVTVDYLKNDDCYKTTKISSQEINVPYELATIDAPKYFESCGNYYQGTFTFFDQPPETTGTDISFVDEILGTGITEIAQSWEGHSRVLHLKESTGVGSLDVAHIFGDRTEGGLELWWYPISNGGDHNKIFLEKEDGTVVGIIFLSGSNNEIRYSDTYNSLLLYEGGNNQWNHISIQWIGNDVYIKVKGGNLVHLYLKDSYDSIGKMVISNLNGDECYIGSPSYLFDPLYRQGLNEKAFMVVRDNYPFSFDSDIGIFGGLLRNSPNKQNLMIKQTLMYEFEDSQLGPVNLVLDEVYTDSILRLKSPQGYLKNPSGDHIPNNVLLTFITNQDVTSIEVYSYNMSNHLLSLGNMTRNPNNFEEFSLA
ncbi:MAG: hypothetical protein P8Y97_22290, partial [Candidatus Lokiarchaeota archaeon]